MFKSLAARSRFQCVCLSAFKIALLSAACAASREIALSEPAGFWTRFARFASRPLSLTTGEETRVRFRCPSVTMLWIMFSSSRTLPGKPCCFCRKLERLALKESRVALDEVVRQGGNFLWALAEWRHVDSDDIQPVEELL